MSYGPPFDSERELIILRKPTLCWWREAIIGEPMDVHPLCWEPWTEVCAFTRGVAPGVDPNNGNNPSDTVHRLFFLDHRGDTPEGAYPNSAPDDARMIVATHPKQPAPRPSGRGFSGKIDFQRELAWQKIYQDYWRSKLAIESQQVGCETLADYVLAQETHIVPLVDCFRQLPWCMESTYKSFDFRRDSYPDKVIVAYSTGSTHSRVWHVPPRAADLPAPKGAIDPKSIVAGQPTRPARRRWFPVPRHVRLSV